MLLQARDVARHGGAVLKSRETWVDLWLLQSVEVRRALEGLLWKSYVPLWASSPH
jgi:hypothetical protein